MQVFPCTGAGFGSRLPLMVATGHRKPELRYDQRTLTKYNLA